MSPKMKKILKTLNESSQSEAIAIADCLSTIAENDQDDEEVRMGSDEFLLGCAEELRDWASYVVKELQT
jgi:hypothetical protein